MTTNYASTFIAVATDCPVDAPVVPPASAEKPTIASLQYELIAAHPYELTSDDVLFAVHARRAGIPDSALDDERARFFAKDQACLRASPPGKRYGWGTHHDEQGRVALVGVGTSEYDELVRAEGLEHKTAMRSSRA